MNRGESRILGTKDVPLVDLIPRYAGFEDCEPGHAFGPAVRNTYLLHYCLAGQGIFRARGEEYTVHAGELFVIRPGEVTYYRADTGHPWHYVWIAFDGTLASRFDGAAAILECPAAPFRAIVGLVREGEADAEPYLVHIHEILYALFARKKQRSDAWERVRDHIEINYMAHLNVEKIAASTGFDRRYLSHVFRERYGAGIKEYILDVRTEKAAAFLLAGKTVVETAMLVGYTDVFQFSKIFKKKTGFSPSEYRKRDAHTIKQ